MHALNEFSSELSRVLAIANELDFEIAIGLANRVRDRQGCVYFIGNGGSAAIASHMALDWMNKGRFKTHDLNSSVALTCFANDYGYRHVFERQLWYMQSKDLLVAISSSGKSDSIILAAEAALKYRAIVMVLSGFAPDNRLLQTTADIKFHIPSENYAIVENAHMAILHAMLEALKQ